MPDGNTTTEGQEPNNNSTPEGEGSGRTIDAFPDDAKDYIRRLRAENAGHRNDRKALEDKLKAFEDRDKSEQQKLQERAEAAERKAADTEVRLLRFEVAAAKGIPAHLADRLRGATKEELEKDADALRQDFGLADGGQPAGRPSFDGGVRRPVTQPKNMNDLIRQRVLG